MKSGDLVTTKSGRKGAICDPPFDMPGYLLVDFGDKKQWVILEAIAR